MGFYVINSIIIILELIIIQIYRKLGSPSMVSPTVSNKKKQASKQVSKQASLNYHVISKHVTTKK